MRPTPKPVNQFRVKADLVGLLADKVGPEPGEKGVATDATRSQTASRPLFLNPARSLAGEWGTRRTRPHPAFLG